MSLGEVDTLNLMVEKLENLFNESQDYYETFLDTNNSVSYTHLRAHET